MMTRVHQSAIVAVTGLAAVCVSSSASAISADCFREHRTKIKNCKNTYNNQAPNGIWNWNNAIAYQACLDAAAADKDLCEAGTLIGSRTTLWVQLKADIKLCFDDFLDDDMALEACIASALDEYMDGVDLLLNPPPPDDGCVESFPASRLGGIESLDGHSQSTDGNFAVSMMTNFSIQAGVSTEQGGLYDVGLAPCIKQAVLLAIHQTKTGVETEIVSVDLDTSDGTQFVYPLLPSKYVGADSFVLVALFFDESNNARFAELSTVTIMPSPVQGDWNRDGVKDAQDIVDYTDFYGLQKKSADLNQDDNVDSVDLAEFITDFAG